MCFLSCFAVKTALHNYILHQQLVNNNTLENGQHIGNEQIENGKQTNRKMKNTSENGQIGNGVGLTKTTKKRKANGI